MHKNVLSMTLRWLRKIYRLYNWESVLKYLVRSFYIISYETSAIKRCA